MKGEDKKLVRFFEGSDKRFIIPLYQRNYDWEIKHCRHLFSDLVKLHEEARRSHFFGSIVTCRANDVYDDYLVIDGQQRITTISLLLIAMVNAAKAGDLAYDDKRKIDMIYRTYIVDEYQDDERKIKLKPIKNDMKSFDALIYYDPEKYIRESNVTRNYEFFYNELKSCTLKLEDIFESIKKLVVIDIRLERDDDAQLIFESLNSTGLDLSEADKIRNFLLMSMNAEQQEQCYEKYWNKIEVYTGYDPTMFVRDFLTVRTKTIPNIENLYFDFKSFVERYGLSREEVMAEMTEYAKYWDIFTNQKADDYKLNVKFKQLNTIESTVGMAFYMAFLKYACDNHFTPKEIFDVFDLIEAYWARRIMCNYPANAMNKAFATMHQDVLRLRGEQDAKGIEPSKYIDILRFVLLKRQGTGTFPSDLEVAEEFKKRQIYRIPQPYRNFLFERMENCDNVEGKWENIVPHIKDGSYTIEHIMPQTLTAAWRQQLGADAERIYEEYLHTFANLTLTGYNSSYSNRPFEEKKKGYDYKGKHIYGFDESHFSLSNYIKTVDQWTEKELLERQKILLDRFMRLWPMPTTNFKPVEKDTDHVPFEDEDTVLTGRKIIAFSYKDEHIKVSSWKEMLVAVCQLLYKDSPSSMHVLCNANTWVHNNPSPEYSPFADGCYVLTSCGTPTKISCLRYLFSKLNLMPSDLEFELMPLTEFSETEIAVPTESDNE